MRTQQFLAALMLAAAPIFVYAVDDDFDNVGVLPEPATLALLGIGLAAVVIARASKRK